MQPLGDPHNFGRRVYAEDNRLFKPRAIMWEWLFLSPNSPFKSFLVDLAAREEQISPLAAFPSVLFDEKIKSSSDLLSGFVHRYQINPIQHQQKMKWDDCHAIGAAIAAMVWFGIGDLYLENMILGVNSDGNLIFGPLDIECVFNNFYLPSQTLLTPSPHIESSAVGLSLVRAAQKLLDFPEAMLSGIISGYVAGVDLLEGKRPVIEAFLTRLFATFGHAPIRIIPRPTSIYSHAIRTNTVGRPFSECEREQLTRKDIPYYFREIGSHVIQYYSEPDKASPASLLPEQSDKITKLIPPANNILGQSEGASMRIKAGALQLARYFEPEEKSASYHGNDCEVVYTEDTITITHARHKNFSCQRRISERKS